MERGPGLIGLVGSGEYLPEMSGFEAKLLEGRPPRYVQVPTAAAKDPETKFNYWIELGRQQAERLGVEAVVVPVKERSDAYDARFIDEIAGAGLIYFSGGNPHHLADTLRDTPFFDAILAAWRGGASLAGCSAGAMALSSWIPGFIRMMPKTHPGLGVVEHLGVLPHFDRMRKRVPDFLTTHALHPPEGTRLIGIDELTGVIGEAGAFEVWGAQSVWEITSGELTEYRVGDRLNLG